MVSKKKNEQNVVVTCIATVDGGTQDTDLFRLVCFWFILKFFIYYLSHNIIESVDFLPAEQRECSLTGVVIRVTCCLTGMMSQVLN